MSIKRNIKISSVQVEHLVHDLPFAIYFKQSKTGKTVAGRKDNYRRLLEEMLGEVGAQFRSVMAVSSLQAERQFTASGLGVCLLAGTAVEEDLQEKRLVALPWAGPDFRIAVQIVYHKNKWISPALRTFIDLARKELETNML